MNKRSKPTTTSGKRQPPMKSSGMRQPTRPVKAAKPRKTATKAPAVKSASVFSMQLAKLDAWFQRVGGILTGKSLGETAQRWMFVSRCVLSVGAVFYLLGVVLLSYYSMFYRLEIPEEQRGTFCLLTSLACFGILLVFLYTRKQILTRICIMLAMPFYLFVFLFNYRHLVLLIPLGLLIVISYFSSGVKEGPKTILGSVYLMIYILGTFGYLLASDLLKPASVQTICESGTSSSASYRYAVTEVQDKADGSTFVSVEPNTYDVLRKHHRWVAKGYDKTIYLVRPKTTFAVEWKIESRTAITEELLTLNPNITFALNATQLKTIGKDVGYSEAHTVSDLTRAQRAQLGIAIEKDLLGGQTAESLGLALRKTTDPLTLSYDQLLTLGMTISSDVKLSDLTDANLAALGVPVSNDVLYVNGKAVFRQYVAALEETFAVDKRSYNVIFDF